MLSFPFRKGREHPDCPRGLPSVAFARRRVGGEVTVAIAAFGECLMKENGLDELYVANAGGDHR